MKKLLVSLLTLSLVFAVVASVSAAAPVVTGKLAFETYENADPTGLQQWGDVRFFFNGDIDETTNYSVALQYTSNGTFKVREAFATYKTGVGNVSFGKIRVIPTIADLTDGIAPNFGDGITSAPFVLKYGYDVNETTNLGLTVVAGQNGDSSSTGTYKNGTVVNDSFTEAGAFVAEAHTKVSIFNLGANYQYEGKGDAGYAVQVSTSLFDSLNLWAEAGKLADKSKALSDDQTEAYLFGFSYTIGKVTFEAEKQFNDDAILYGGNQWGAKIGYALTDNVSIEYLRSSNYYLGGADAIQFFKDANDNVTGSKDRGVSFLKVSVTF